MNPLSPHDAFIAAMLPTARKYEALTGFAAEGAVAINISETGWGAAGSYFGIKGTGNAGGIDYTTWENYGQGAEHTVINDQFAAYKSVDDAYAAFWAFLRDNSRYAAALAAFNQTHDWKALLHGINQAGYATDPNWWSMIIALSETVKASPAWTLSIPTEEIMTRFNAVVPRLQGADLPVTVAPGEFQGPGGAPLPSCQRIRIEVYLPAGTPPVQVHDSDGSYAGQVGWDGARYGVVEVDVSKGAFTILGQGKLAQVGIVAYA